MAADPTGTREAQDAASIGWMDTAVIPTNYRQIPVPVILPDLDKLIGTECVVQVVRDPVAPTGRVICQSACQRIGTPNVVDLRVLLIGSGTFTWSDTNSGYSIDGGTSYHALAPDTGDSLADPVNGVVVNRERQFNLVLDLDTLYSDATGEDAILDFRVSFTVT